MNLCTQLRKVRFQIVSNTLKSCGGSKTLCARILEIHPNSVTNILKRGNRKDIRNLNQGRI